MKILSSLFGLATLTATAQVEFVPDETPRCLFTGTEQKVPIVVRNESNDAIQRQVRMRINQLSSAVAMPLGPAREWRTLHLLPHQTAIESLTIKFPPVAAATRFEVVWLNVENSILGRTEFLGYPPNLLSALKPVVERKLLGVFDPATQLKPLLKQTSMDFEDLEVGEGLAGFNGALAILFPGTNSMPRSVELTSIIRKKAKQGVAFVWIQNVRPDQIESAPLAYTVRVNTRTVVVAEASTVAHLAESPVSQLNLIRFAELALGRVSLDLPGSETSN